MIEKKRVYNTACFVNGKPAFATEKPVFYRCNKCGNVVISMMPVIPSQTECLRDFQPGTCCGEAMTRLQVCQDSNVQKEHDMKFCVFGGQDHNTIRVEVDGAYHPMNEEHHIEWIYLRTFQGGQMKYLPLKKESATLFSMANNDAFVFCDREICRMGWEHCAFQCKRGHVAYAYCNKHGLFELQF